MKKAIHLNIFPTIPQSIIYILLMNLSIINLLFMHYNIILTCNPESSLDTVSWIDNLSAVILDAFIILLISIPIALGKIKQAIAISFIFTLLWSYTNILYSRFFQSYLTLSSFNQINSLSDFIVLESIIQGIKWIDFYFIIVPALFYYLYRQAQKTLMIIQTIKYTILITISVYILDIAGHTIYCISDSRYQYFFYFRYRISSRHIRNHAALCEPLLTTFHRGNIRTLISEVIMNLRYSEKLNNNQLSEIEKTINDSKHSMIHDTNIRNNINNIIFIIVESYMSFTSDLIIDGQIITPFLNSLRHNDSTYYNGHLTPNITIGESADGQFIYMTGLLPLRSAITISKARNRTLPGLPKLLSKRGFSSRMIIPTSPNLWNQSTMCKQYGFSRLFSLEDYKTTISESIATSLSDQQTFELAHTKDLESKKRFFSVILTMSMHQPYTKCIDPTFIINNDSISDELKCYLNACHYTDNEIKNYINKLKENGLYDNSLIIITADHHVHSTNFGEHISNEIPLYIINGNINVEKAWKGPCNQIDVYTTLIDLLGIPTEWYGLGNSLLSQSYRNSLNKNKWDVSEWIIHSDYFKTKTEY